MAPRTLKAYFLRAAEDEYLETRRRYQEESQQIADVFEAEVMRGIAFIERFPEGSPAVGGNVRRKVLRKPFEYSLFYAIEKDRIRILAVAHHRREPGYWAGR